jgi:hypothetical protein
MDEGHSLWLAERPCNVRENPGTSKMSDSSGVGAAAGYVLWGTAGVARGARLRE